MPSTPQPAFDPRSTIIRPRMPVSVPSLRAPISSSVTCADAGFVAAKSSCRVIDEAHRAAERERGACGEWLDERELPSECPAKGLGDDPDLSSGSPKARASSSG